MANQRDRLLSLWAEVTSIVTERELSLGELDGLWQLFDEQKERVVEFMRTAELHMCLPPVLGRPDVNLSVIDVEIRGSLVRRGSLWRSMLQSHACTRAHTHTDTHTHTRM